MSRPRRPSGTHHRSRLDVLEISEQNEYVPSRIELGKIFPLKPVIHKRGFSLSNEFKSKHQDIRHSSTLADQAAVRQQRKTAREIDPISASHLTGRKHQDQNVQMLQQKFSKAVETLQRAQTEKNRERDRCHFENNTFYGNGYGERDEERDTYGTGRDDMERWEEWERERRRESVKREGRRRPSASDTAKSHKPEEEREWDEDYGHTGRRERGTGWDDHVRGRTEMHDLYLDRDEDVRRERRGSEEGSGQAKDKRLQRVELTPKEDPGAPQRLMPCSVCGRCFAADRLETHMRVCEKKRPERKIFDMSRHRAKGTQIEEFMKTNGRSKTPPKKNTWQQKHQALIQAMRQGQDARPQPGSDLHPEYVSCPHCGRRFAPGPAERHIPKCQNIRSRPAPLKPPPSSARRTTAR
ncbi:hypothetical protein R3I94_012301 [Phoxinus phoxinus]